MRRPSLPNQLHKEKGDETFMFVAFLLPQIGLLLSILLKTEIQKRSWCGFDSCGPAYFFQVSGYSTVWSGCQSKLDGLQTRLHNQRFPGISEYSAQTGGESYTPGYMTIFKVKVHLKPTVRVNHLSSQICQMPRHGGNLDLTEAKRLRAYTQQGGKK